MNENLRRIEKAIKQVKKIKPENDIEVKYVNQIKTLLYNLQRHIEDDYRRLLDGLPEIPDERDYSGEYRRHVLDEVKKHDTIELSDTNMLVRKGTTGSRRECEWSSKTIPINEYEPEPTLMPEQPKEMKTDDEPPDDAICTREVKMCKDCEFYKPKTEQMLSNLCMKRREYMRDFDTCDDFKQAEGKCKDCRYFKRSDNGLDNMCLKHKDYIWEDNGHCDDFQMIFGRCKKCRHFKSVGSSLMGLCSKHDKSVGNDETCDDFVYKLLSERIKDGTVGCKCNKCGRAFRKDEGYTAMKGDNVQAFLCEQCYETAYKGLFGRKDTEDRFKPCPMCNGKIVFNTTKDILEPEYQHIECSKCGFSWKYSPTLEDEDKLVEYINHSIDSLNNDKPKEVKP